MSVSPRQVYVDATRTALVEGFIRNTITAMVEGIRHPAIGTRLITMGGGGVWVVHPWTAAR